MRKVYLDHLRGIIILLLFPVHTFMIWNNFGTKFYVWGGNSNILSTIITVVNPWFMSLLFVIAGMCARYSLEKRSLKEFVKERFQKLFIPFISGLMFLVPFQTFYARKFFFSYDGSFLENYKFFFTHFTDLSGYDGGFTPGHLWFILFLLIISCLGLIITHYIPYKSVYKHVKHMHFTIILLLFIPVWLFYYLGNFGGFSLGKYAILYLIGYYVLSDQNIIEKIFHHKKLILLLFLITQTTLSVLYFMFSYYGDFLVNLVGWLGILSCLCVGKTYLNRDVIFLKYLNSASFGIYILHQTILVIVGYYVLTLGIGNTLIQVLIIMFSSFLITIMAYEIVRRITYIRAMIGKK